jgi:hypothetical protein
MLKNIRQVLPDCIDSACVRDEVVLIIYSLLRVVWY